jgi:hypothetical protein
LLINYLAWKVDVLFHFPSRSQNPCNRTYGKKNTHTPHTHKTRACTQHIQQTHTHAHNTYNKHTHMQHTHNTQYFHTGWYRTWKNIWPLSVYPEEPFHSAHFYYRCTAVLTVTGHRDNQCLSLPWNMPQHRKYGTKISHLKCSKISHSRQCQAFMLC